MAEANVDNFKDGNEFYRKHFHKIIGALITSIVFMVVMVIILSIQIQNRPIPLFVAVSSDGQKMQLTSYNDPNLLSTTLIKWASKAAVAAYTFDFYNYQKQLDQVRPYFTDAGWVNYKNSIQSVINTITSNKLFVNGVVSAPPVISNQGALGGYDRVWRIQIPFLVTYQSAESTATSSYIMTLMVVNVPTTENPAAIAIDQIIMG